MQGERPQADRQLPLGEETFLDHVGHFVRDPQAASGALARAGFAPTPVSVQVNPGADGSERLTGTGNVTAMLSRGYIVHGIKRRSSSLNTDRIDYLYRDRHEMGVRLFLHYGDMTDGTALVRHIGGRPRRFRSHEDGRGCGDGGLLAGREADFRASLCGLSRLLRRPLPIEPERPAGHRAGSAQERGLRRVSPAGDGADQAV